MQRALASLTALLLVAGLAAAVVEADVEPEGPGAPPDTAAATTTEATVVVPGPGQTRVTGTVVTLRSDGAVGPPLAAPLVFVAERGVGRATFRSVTVGGRDASIVWDGGRPFELQPGRQTPGPGLALGPAPLEVTADRVVWHLDGAARSVLPGAYRTPTSVAVGVRGLAEPRDGVAFAAVEASTVQTTGGVRVERPPTELLLTGPASLEISGAVTLQTADATTEAPGLTFGPGPFQVRLGPVPGGWAIDALLQGDVRPVG